MADAANSAAWWSSRRPPYGWSATAITVLPQSGLAVLGERTVEPVCVERPLGVARRPAEPAQQTGPRPAGLALDGENVGSGYAGISLAGLVGAPQWGAPRVHDRAFLAARA